MLKQTSLAGISTVFYKKFAINLPDMAYSEQRYETETEVLQLPELSDNEWKKGREKIAKMRNDLKDKFRIN